MGMDPEYSLQDVVRCHLCETLVPSVNCDICNIHLCTTCEAEHLKDESTKHKVVPFKRLKYTPKCQKHLSKICKLYCVRCDIPICTLCVSFKEHDCHDVLDILNGMESKRNVLQKDLLELENFIYPKYEKIAYDIPLHKINLNINYKKLISAINKHEEELHREIDAITQTLRSDLDEMDSKILADLNRHEDEITRTISEITQRIADLKNLLNSKDISLCFAYKSRNAEMLELNPKLTLVFPNFAHYTLNETQIHQQCVSLLALLKKNSPGVESSLQDRPIIDLPRIISEINTDYENFNFLRSVSCQDDQSIWTRGDDDILRLYNLKGELVESLKTQSGNDPTDIAVTRGDNLVYTDYNDRTVNIENTKMQTVIRLRGWKPDCVCSTFKGDLLIVMDNDVCNRTKVVRYANFTEVQSIQYDDKGKPLYSSGNNYKYICENRNLDICVSDRDARAVVVVNEAGKLRFTYTGPPSTTKESFEPCGVTTDSQSRILAADIGNHIIHILDQDGQFIHFIVSVVSPIGLCVDTRDNLYVAERDECRVKKIQYCM